MTGKKVFTGAGEYLASFLITLKNEETQTKNLNDTLATITGSSLANDSTGVSLYQNSKNYTKEETIEIIKVTLKKELSYLKTSYSGKELPIQEMAQTLYNTLKWVETDTKSKFEALVEITFDNISEIFKTIGINKRSYLRKIKELTTAIALIPYYSLDDFKGDTDDKSRLYYKFDGSMLKVCNGAGTNSSFYEIFKVKSKEYVLNQSWLGDELIVGGTESSSPFKTIRIMKDQISEGNITLIDGKELKGTALKARYADLAEYYTTNCEYKPGTLLQIDLIRDNELTIFDPANNVECIGVVSDKPGFILNSDFESEYTLTPVVLTGRSPIRVVGPVAKGDYIYPSRNIPGVGVAIKPAYAKDYEDENVIFKRIGIALESTNFGNIIPNESLINAKIN